METFAFVIFILALNISGMMLGLGILLLRTRQVGGLHHWRIGRIGGSFYIRRKS